MSWTPRIALFFCGAGVGGMVFCGCRRQTPATNPTTSARATGVATTQPGGPFNPSPKHILLGGREVRIPIELVSNLPVIWFKSEDGTRRRLIVDTGSDAVILTSELVAAQHFATRRSNRIPSDPSGNGAVHPAAAVPVLDLGPVRFLDFDADVASSLYAGSDAQLGWPLFVDLLVTIDYPQRRALVLRQGELPPPDGRHVVPLRLDSDHLMVQATVARRTVWMNLDTGWADGANVALSNTLSGELAWASAPVPTMSTKTTEGATTQKLGRLKEDLLLGGYRIVQPVAGASGWGSMSIIGAQSLANFVVTIDLNNMRKV